MNVLAPGCQWSTMHVDTNPEQFKEQQ